METNTLNTLLGAIYTLTPTHCGTGQTAGAVDLPIARESTTGLPVLPASMLKGVARELFQLHGSGNGLVRKLFGPDTNDDKLEAGHLIFTEGRLLALPVRSLNRAFLYATSPLLLQRLDRDLRAFGREGVANDWTLPAPETGEAQVADAELAGKTLAVEDLVYESSQVGGLSQLEQLVDFLAGLLPDNEAATQERLRRNLIVLPDDELLYLCQAAVPVQARIQLGEGKTTSRFVDEDGGEKRGNLWYEETLPADALFTFFVASRRDAKSSGARTDATEGDDSPVDQFRRIAGERPHIQIGGNQTVGQGWCWWTFR